LFRASNFDLKFSLSSVSFFTLGKEGLCRVSKKTLGKEGTLPSVKKTLGKEVFAECFFYTRQSTLFAECFILPSVFSLALGKEALCRVPEKKTLGKPLDTRQRAGFR